MLTLSACVNVGQQYGVTIVIKENGEPLPGVEATYSGSKITGGTAGPSGGDGKLIVQRIIGTVEISLSKEGYFFDPEVLMVTKAGVYSVQASCLPQINKVAKPVINVSKDLAANRDEEVTFSLETEVGVNYYYTLDGSQPHSTSLLYQDPVVLTPPDTDDESTIEIRAMGKKEGWRDSEIAEKIVVYQAKQDETNWNDHFNSLDGEEFFKIHSIWAVDNTGPTESSIFTLEHDAKITGIFTYHWNADEDTFREQTISLKKDDNTIYGPWPVKAGNGSWNKSNVNWYVFPDQTIPAGTYTIIDSHNDSWSKNSETGNRGMCTVKGISYSEPR
jgi:hypothetical protein